MRTIELENRFAIELDALQTTVTDPLLVERYGWQLPDSKEHKTTYAKALSEGTLNYLLVTAPAIIQLTGIRFFTSHDDSIYSSASPILPPRTEEEQREIDRDLYGIE